LQTSQVQLVTGGTEFGMVSKIEVTNRAEFDQFLRIFSKRMCGELEKDARARIGIQIVNPSSISVYALGDYFEIQLI
jgi:hypothetical protein